MASKTFYYARVSTEGQNLDRQIEAFKALGADDRDIITDKASGKDFDRPNYTALRNSFLRDGDTLVIKSLDRLGRNKQAVKEELAYFQANNIRLKILDIPTTMMDFQAGEYSQAWLIEMVNNIILEVYSTLAEEERARTLERQAEGNAAMKIGEDGKRHSNKTGRAVGRPVWEKPKGWDRTVSAYKSGAITASQAIKILGVSRSSFYKQIANEEAAK